MSESVDLAKVLASGGPWAVTTGFLLWWVLRAWERDRAALASLLSDFRATLDRLSRSIEELAHRIERIEDAGREQAKL